MTADHREVEGAYLLPLDEGLPDLATVEHVCRVGEPEESTYEVTYFDTPDRRLASDRVILRLHSGSSDIGWYLKAGGDADDDATELRAARRADNEVPAELVHAVRAYVRSDALVPVATLRTRRTARRLYDRHGASAIVADDVVQAHQPGDGGAELERWHEVDVEPINGSGEILLECDAAFRAAGLVPSPFPSKLHHALKALPALKSTAPRKGSAGIVVARHLDDLVHELLRRDHDARETPAMASTRCGSPPVVCAARSPRTGPS